MTKLLGGTELMVERLKNSLPEDLLSNFQIIATRLNEALDESKIRIAYIHDLAEDPQLNYLANGGWSKFHLLVFVSNWQMQSFIAKFNIPWSKCLVIQNAIEPMPAQGGKADDVVRLIYTPTPHRGLEILVPVFLKLLETHGKDIDLRLDVFSSFELYGWGERDKQFEPLFQMCKDHPSINYHGSAPNDVIREHLQKADIFAYPSIWTETSCLCLIEAMSAGLICVHPNLGALAETSANWTYQYQFQENKSQHAGIFYNILTIALQNIKNDDTLKARLLNQKTYADQFYNWNTRKDQWLALFNHMVTLPRAFEKPSNVLVFNTENALR
jgi:UDP-glucose:(glucosyl)LPS alpha-1,2-glucosyltransferase